jgi:membrane associated rhomboid family serine protease
MGFGRPSSSTIKLLLIANAAVFGLQLLMSRGAEFTFLRSFGLVPTLAIGQLHIWQFFTYMFIHGGFFHLFLNMFALWMFGSEIESIWGRRSFLTYYIVCGLGGGLTYALLSWNSQVPLVGASGAIFGLLLAFGLMFPERRIYLYFLFPIKAKYFVLLFGLFELIAVTQQRADGIGHLAHLGGMVVGYLFLKGGMRLPRFGGGSDRLRSAIHRYRMKSRMRVVRPEDDPSGPRSEEDRINEILEKISREGLQSLTEEEQEILRRASRRH